MLNWINANKEWLFSGIGISLITLLYFLLKFLRFFPGTATGFYILPRTFSGLPGIPRCKTLLVFFSRDLIKALSPIGLPPASSPEPRDGVTQELLFGLIVP